MGSEILPKAKEEVGRQPIGFRGLILANQAASKVDVHP